MSEHAIGELGNEYRCQRILRDWEKNHSRSAQVIPYLHSELMRGVEDYQQKGLTPLPPGRYRNTNVTLGDKASNFYASSYDVPSLMAAYTSELDRRLSMDNRDPNPMSALNKTMEDAAWAYYTFARIHPFLDGNGRTGRMILKRVIKGGGYKDIVFQTSIANGRNRSAHLEAMNAVDKTGTLDPLEVYLLKELGLRYLGDTRLTQASGALIAEKEARIGAQKGQEDLTNVWSGFAGKYIAGVPEMPEWQAS